jgi:2-haloacid dehalogenase
MLPNDDVPVTGGLSRLTTLVFDVIGTVVDDQGSLERRVGRLLQLEGIDASGASTFTANWEQMLDESITEVVTGKSPWQSHRRLRQSALHQVWPTEQWGVLSQSLSTHLAAAVEYLEPWPDSVGALETLRDSFRVVALSNGDSSELVGLSANAGLAWHGVFSAERVHSFKPNRAVYQSVLDSLEESPAAILMVAAHPWDLRAAATLGFSTAYVSRPGADSPSSDDDFDFTATDLADLARQLAPTR